MFLVASSAIHLLRLRINSVWLIAGGAAVGVAAPCSVARAGDGGLYREGAARLRRPAHPPDAELVAVECDETASETRCSRCWRSNGFGI